MNDTQGAPAKKGLSPTAKVLVYGCLILVALGVLVAVGVGVGGYFLVQRGKDFVKSMEQEVETGRQIDQNLLELEAAHPTLLGSELDQARLSGEQLDAYLRICRTIAPELNQIKGLTERFNSLQEGKASPSLDLVGLPLKIMKAHNAAMSAWLDQLRSEQMAPSDFRAIASLVEWRFLRRPEALLLGLPEHEATELEGLRNQIRALEQLDKNPAFDVMPKVFGDKFEDPAEKLPELRARLEELENEAQANVLLHPDTAALLEERRPELEGDERPVEQMFRTDHGGVNFSKGDVSVELSKEWPEPEAEPEPDAAGTPE
jgi:hypothetical protein